MPCTQQETHTAIGVVTGLYHLIQYRQLKIDRLVLTIAPIECQAKTKQSLGMTLPEEILSHEHENRSSYREYETSLFMQSGFSSKYYSSLAIQQYALANHIKSKKTQGKQS